MAIGDTYVVSYPFNSVNGHTVVYTTDPDSSPIYVAADDVTMRFKLTIIALNAWTFIQVGPYVPNVLILSDPGVGNLVTNGWNNAQTYASNAFSSANNFIGQLVTKTADIGGLADFNSSFTPLTLDISAFNTIIGSAPLAPGSAAAFTELPYSSTYLNDLRAQLDSWVNGAATGIKPSVEQAIWDRARARESVASQQKVKEAMRLSAMRGFTRPMGAVVLDVMDAYQQGQNNNVTQSRDVMIKQADMEQSNRHFAFEQAWKAEEGMINYLNGQMQRAVEMAKEINLFSLTVFQHQTSLYNTQAQVYSAKVGAATSVFKAEVDENIAAANIGIEAYKANIQKRIQQITLIVESIKSSAQMSAQMASSALAAVNLSGGIHMSTSNSANNSANVNKSFNSSVQTSTSNNTSTQTSTSNNTSTQTSTSDNTNHNLLS